ncbi:MAG: glutathione S-transferase [Celeribacter sp.]
MKLHFSPTSPYVRKVMITLHETGLLDQVELLSGSGTPLDSGQAPVSVNPLGKVPVLLREDGPAIYDSRVITRYLDSLSGDRLYPQARIWDVLTLESIAEGMLDAALLMAYEWRLRPEEIRFPDWVDGQWAKVERALIAIEDRWMSHLAGPLTAAQIAVVCALGYLDLRNADRNWRQHAPQLAEWYARMAERDSMIATAPPAV